MALIKAGATVRSEGACTALVAALDDTRTMLHTVTVGDAGLRVLRKNKLPWPFLPPYSVVARTDANMCFFFFAQYF